MSYDVAVVGAGIVGLAHALAAARKGRKVVVIDRDTQANGASIRNFGFVTVTGQEAGDCWRLARRSREIWGEVAPAAGIEILQRGLVVTARRPESEAVIDAFLKTEMGAECRRLTLDEAQETIPALRRDALSGVLHSPHEVRVESRTAIPRLAAWLAEAHGVAFRWSTSVTRVATPRVETSAGVLEAETVIVCPGDDFVSLFPDRIAPYRATRCKLQMMRVRPAAPVAFAAPVMSDLGLARYKGYADLPEAAALKARLDSDQAEHRANGVHLIVVQSADGSLVVGDSHHYDTTPDPFAPVAVRDLILDEMDQVLDLPGRTIEEHWVGTYASAADRWRFTDAPDAATRIVVVTAGCGASTAFGIGEETVSGLFG
ncbi:TIGR03364 family FAD-dependent oxidoreductase [Polymorphum gilvum]|uniref:FAD dependent oxidoreductase TIGR03364 n=1 Tax=Polymorphum gilvum (strain LMG 25793 / CGMCC 1.9160 / SL003B-26A1) TaxID=991905 RepID=F2IWT5_POLGS|nr:TIGR03364 family FAD-dependent oxidoreductase [Polymorphum gilvum]ADZ71512.1 FAD dependent oxidoreductase TIGR03364 [Polymorphum gilvum SL003B-26A1]